MKDSVRTAAVYDFTMRALDRLLIKGWRKQLWAGAKGPEILEVGVGTGLNTDFYKDEFKITALDNNRSFLETARRRAEKKEKTAEFMLGDIENLPFAANSFDTALSTFLFCQLEAPELGMAELNRVLKPGGQLLLLEHVRTQGLSGRILEAISGPLYKLTGDHIARNTEETAAKAGFVNISSKSLFTRGVKIISAEKKQNFGTPKISGHNDNYYYGQICFPR